MVIWSGQVTVLGSFERCGVLLIWIIHVVGLGPTGLVVGVSRSCLGILLFVSSPERRLGRAVALPLAALPFPKCSSFMLKFLRSYSFYSFQSISVIFGMMIDVGLKFYSKPSPPLVMTYI